MILGLVFFGLTAASPSDKHLPPIALNMWEPNFSCSSPACISWIERALKETPLEADLAEEFVAGKRSQFLSTLEEARRAYLRMDLGRALADCAEARAQLFGLAPHALWKSDYQDLMTLHFLVLEGAKPNRSDRFQELLVFQKDARVLSALQNSKRTELMAAPSSQEERPIAVPELDQASQVYFFGERRISPFVFRDGVYIIQTLTGAQAKIYRAIVQENKIELTLLEQTFANRSFPSRLKQNLRRSIPPEFARRNIIIREMNGLGETYSIELAPSASSQNLTMPAHTSDFLKAEKPKTEKDATPSLLNSKWFWIGVGSLVGIGSGILIYDTSRSQGRPSSVRTP